MSDFPLIEELSPPPNVADALIALRDWPELILFESSQTGVPTGRYSYLTASPVRFFSEQTPKPANQNSKIEKEDSLAEVEAAWQSWQRERVPDLPPFQGGIAGLLSYDMNRAWEKIPRPKCDEFEMPVMAIGLYDWVLAWDHWQSRAWIICHAHPGDDRATAVARTNARCNEIRAALAGSPHCQNFRPHTAQTKQLLDQLAPAWRVDGRLDLWSNFSRDDYLRTVERAIEYIHAGDLFQVNLSQRLLAPLREDPLEIYLRLRLCNPAPFSGYFAHDDWVIASASPERFLSVQNREVETRPIKGTRRRRTGPEADLYTQDELRESEKDVAENVMIVDLLRNDLSRVCQAGSIRVPHLCRVETYETVQHLVSEIRGRLSPGATTWDLFRAAFPGGSITGAPKVRAMEIIAELEPTARGSYCGSLFFVGFDGTTDSNILIRTFTMRRGWIQCPVGGGIVAQSDPAAEYEETMIKAEGMLRALGRI